MPRGALFTINVAIGAHNGFACAPRLRYGHRQTGERFHVVRRSAALQTQHATEQQAGVDARHDAALVQRLVWRGALARRATRRRCRAVQRRRWRRAWHVLQQAVGRVGRAPAFGHKVAVLVVQAVQQRAQTLHGVLLRATGKRRFQRLQPLQHGVGLRHTASAVQLRQQLAVRRRQRLQTSVVTTAVNA